MGKIPNLTNIFQMGWNHHLARCLICVRCLLISFNEILETLWRSAVNFPSTNYQDFGVVRFVFSRFCSKMVPVTETTKRNDSNMLWYHVSWWLQISFIFTPNYLGNDSHLTCAYFSNWVGSKNHQLVVWVVVSNIFYFHPYLGKVSNLTNIFQMDGSTTNELWYFTPCWKLWGCWNSRLFWVLFEWQELLKQQLCGRPQLNNEEILVV